MTPEGAASARLDAAGAEQEPPAGLLDHAASSASERRAAEGAERDRPSVEQWQSEWTVRHAQHAVADPGQVSLCGESDAYGLAYGYDGRPNAARGFSRRTHRCEVDLAASPVGSWSEECPRR